MEIPSTLNELKQKSYNELCSIWEYFFKTPTKAQSPHLIRPIWYKIQCHYSKQKIEQKNITRLNSYALNPDACVERSHKNKYQLKSGTQIIKTFKGKEHIVHIDTPNQFDYKGQKYKTLSAIALTICGHKVSGNDFFGLKNKSGGAVNASISVG